MCISIFYAQVIGLWIFFVALAMIAHQARFKKTLMESLGHASLITFTGIVALAIGLLIVVSHNIWVAAWPVVITLFGWMLIIQGAMRIYWPESFARTMKSLMAGNGYRNVSWVWLLIGIYLIWAGFAS
jgi:hypothetical protein